MAVMAIVGQVLVPGEWRIFYSPWLLCVMMCGWFDVGVVDVFNNVSCETLFFICVACSVAVCCCWYT